MNPRRTIQLMKKTGTYGALAATARGVTLGAEEAITSYRDNYFQLGMPLFNVAMCSGIGALWYAGVRYMTKFAESLLKNQEQASEEFRNRPNSTDISNLMDSDQDEIK